MNIDIRLDLKQQIVEQHAKIVYSYTTDEKEIQLILKWKKIRQIATIILSALTASPAIVKIFSNQEWWVYLSAIAGVILLCLSSYSLNSDNDIKLSRLIDVNNNLWLVREKYLSLLTDYDSLETEQIQKLRNKLTEEISAIYAKRPKTSKKAYKEAQKALQIKEEQTFTKDEAEKLLTTSLRKK